MEGYITWYRQSERNFLHPLQEKRKFTKYEAWQDLVALAYFKDTEKLVQGKLVLIPRGSLDTAAQQLANRWQWDRETVERFLKLLESQVMITRHKINPKNPKSATILSINKYNDFQPNSNNNPTTDTALNAAMDATPNNKGNKENNIYGKKNKKFFKPSVEEIQKYCSERQNGISAESFFDFYESKGWKIGKESMRDWKAAVRNWERNSTSKYSNQNNNGGLNDNEYSPV